MKREWLVPLTGVLFVVLLILSFVVAGEPPDADEPVQDIVDFYVDDKDSIQASILIGGVAAVSLLFFGAYLRKVFNAAEPAGHGLLSPLVLAGDSDHGRWRGHRHDDLVRAGRGRGGHRPGGRAVLAGALGQRLHADRNRDRRAAPVVRPFDRAVWRASEVAGMGRDCAGGCRDDADRLCLLHGRRALGDRGQHHAGGPRSPAQAPPPPPAAPANKKR